MNFSSRIVPNSQEAKIIFTTIVNSPNEDIPIVEMNNTTARDMDVIWNSIEDIAKRW
jgi:copper(I)-binding protein